MPSTLSDTEVSTTWFLDERNRVTMGAWSSSLAPRTVTERIPDKGFARRFSFRSPSIPVPSERVQVIERAKISLQMQTH